MTTQVLSPAPDLPAEMNFFTELGFKLLQIFPDDSPEVAIMTGFGTRVRLDKNANCPPISLQILSDDKSRHNNVITSPAGAQVTFVPESYEVIYPQSSASFEVRTLRDGDPWVIGRAGMLYRDLLPSRIGGSIMASHIRIPRGGPVPDMVHYHTIGFQLIFCYRGWVRLVYEDQGPPFVLEAGDCVTQPPEIRHRVLEASDGLEVIEIGVPAQHMTSIDHQMELPTAVIRRDRKFQGQTFCHHLSKEAVWMPWRMPGFEYRETGVGNASAGMASVQVARFKGHTEAEIRTKHSQDILFTFVMQGTFTLRAHGQDAQTLRTGEAFVVPKEMEYSLSECSDDLELLEVALPGY